MHSFNNSLIRALEASKNPVKAISMSSYMKNQFVFFGVSAPERKLIFKNILKEKGKPSENEWRDIVWELWNEEQRELHYIAQELMFKFKNNYQEEDIDWIEKMILTHSWWDTVDFLAANIVAHFFKSFPQIKFSYIEKWIESENIWLNRTAILFQLKYKNETDEALLYRLIRRQMGAKNFFIAKAIGWALRSYSKVNPSSVRQFIDSHPLQPLSRKEGGKYC